MELVFCAIKNINLFFYGGIIMNKKILILSLLSLVSLSSIQAGICEPVLAQCGRFLDRYGLKILAGYIACGGALTVAACIKLKNRRAYFKGWIMQNPVVSMLKYKQKCNQLIPMELVF
ncbi:MAG: hypothetical protein US13_C0009G0025 [candidate division TM6 bacterium GW2011_GWE2_36_25]|nr:MAG: hypothetical protein US13_C0009G0025 [candidate division TM6 bacterium GW2011_GWE2_36_25]